MSERRIVLTLRDNSPFSPLVDDRCRQLSLGCSKTCRIGAGSDPIYRFENLAVWSALRAKSLTDQGSISLQLDQTLELGESSPPSFWTVRYEIVVP